MRPTSRLDLVLVSTDPDLQPERWRPLVVSLGDSGVLRADGHPGPHADDWIEGGFSRAQLDDPGRIGLWANRQGGFSVRCPVDDATLVSAFQSGMALWRDRADPGLFEVACPTCGSHRADALRFRPDAAFGRCAFVLGHVATTGLRPAADEQVRAVVGPYRVVLRRG